MIGQRADFSYANLSIATDSRRVQRKNLPAPSSSARPLVDRTVVSDRETESSRSPGIRESRFDSVSRRRERRGDVRVQKYPRSEAANKKERQRNAGDQLGGKEDGSARDISAGVL